MRRAKTSSTDVQRRTLLAGVGVALAGCAFGLAAVAAGAQGNEPVWLQLTPAGDFRPVDGRALPVAQWHIDAAVAARVIERFGRRRTLPVVDYEHQTLHKEANGQPAPAAGFMRELRWREDGLWALVALNQRARQMIAEGEYLYFSPVFTYDKASGDVLEIVMGALTNTPAIDGMEPLALEAAATFAGLLSPQDSPQDSPQESDSMNELIAAVAAAFGLAENTNQEQALAALNAAGRVDLQLTALAGLRSALGLAEDAQPQALLAACNALKATRHPDPAQYVPVAALTQVQGELAALTARLAQGELDAVIEQALAEGRLLAGEQEAWARELGRSNMAALSQYLKTTAPIAALMGPQSRTRQPAVGTDAAQLSAAELAVCTATGVSPEQFVKARA